MNILFVCKHNRFRSKVAEALFLKYNKNPDLHVKSAGVELDLLNTFVSPNVVKALEKKGAKVENEKSRQLDEKLLDWADKLVIVADNINPKIFAEKKKEVWKISDTSQHDYLGIYKRVEKIDKKIKVFLKKQETKD